MALQILGKKETALVRTTAFGKKHPVRQMIEMLKPGESLYVTRSDFTWRKKTPNFFCIRISKSSNARFTVKNLEGRTGWLIERIA